MKRFRFHPHPAFNVGHISQILSLIGVGPHAVDKDGTVTAMLTDNQREEFNRRGGAPHKVEEVPDRPAPQPQPASAPEPVPEPVEVDDAPPAVEDGVPVPEPAPAEPAPAEPAPDPEPADPGPGPDPEEVKQAVQADLDEAAPPIPPAA